jgi:uncharacterized repeat protein (TIGR01451 family)
MRTKVAILSVACLLLASHVWAQQKGAIEVKTLAEVEIVVKNDKGKDEVKRVDAAKEKVPPGGVVIFTSRFTNKGKQPATGVVITNPVPEHMTYVDLSAEGKGAKIEFSIDGGKTYGPAEQLKVTEKDGKVRPALPKDYTHIRWTVSAPLTPGATGTVSFHGRVN